MLAYDYVVKWYTMEKVCLISVVGKTEHEHNVSFHYGCMLNDKWDNNYYIIIIIIIIIILCTHVCWVHNPNLFQLIIHLSIFFKDKREVTTV